MAWTYIACINTSVANHDPSLRKAGYVSLCVMGLLLLGSIVWYPQRILFIDPAWVAYYIINKGGPLILEHRYGAITSQIWPLIASKMHLPIRVVLCLYSASFYIFYFAVALLLLRLRQYALCILLAMYFTLLVSDVYFWPNNEVHQGIGWMFLFLGGFFHVSARGAAAWWVHPLLLLSLLMAVFSHFIVIVPCSFLWLYRMLYSRNYWNSRGKRIQLAAYVVAVAALFLVKLSLGKAGWYDSGKLEPLLKSNPGEIIASFSNGAARTMGASILRNYWLLIPVTLAGLAALIRLRQWGRLALLIAYGSGFFALVCLTYPDSYGREMLFYMESEWMAWSLVLATPFVLHVLPHVKPHIALGAIIFIFVVRLAYICASFPFFNERYKKLETITNALRRRHISKAVLIATQQETRPGFLMDWGTAYESLLLSAMAGDKPAISFRILEPDAPIKSPNETLLLAPFGDDSVSRLNTSYFALDSVKSYVTLPLSAVLIDSAINH